MERVKSDLEKEIAAIFKEHVEEDRQGDVAGVIDGVIGSCFRQLETGNRSEKYPSLGYTQKAENKERAANIIDGFLWAMDAAGMISKEKRSEMQDQLLALQFSKQGDEVAT